MLHCNAISENHSDDRTRVFYGKVEPLNLCGFHASYLSPESYRIMRAAGVIR